MMSEETSFAAASKGLLQERRKELALRIIRLVDALPASSAARVIGNQLLRSGTSIGANYRAACRARSKIEFRAKLGICIEEADETIYWLEILGKSGIVQERLLDALMKETDELVAMLVASVKKVSVTSNKKLEQ
ncbi:MAG TPA: four helix bundle protein [Anaerolinea sp.]|nr:four helix bundle protein [Anaerolinea sp.]